MSKIQASLPVLVGIAAVGTVGTMAYVLRRARRLTQARGQGAVEAGSARPELRESMVVPRSTVPEPVTVVLDLDGVFRGEAESEQAGATVQSNAKLPLPTSADDEDPPEADDLGSYWLSRATESERGLSEGDLDIDLENVAVADQADPDEEEDDYGYDDEYVPRESHTGFNQNQRS